MIKYFKNGVLEAETLDLPQDCGEIKVTISLEEEREDANYYLEFACPRNVKYISEQLVRIGEKEYEIILPRGISEYIGEVYVQLLIMSTKEATLLSRSLIARNPLFVVKESILASNALDSSERRDFFEFAQKVVADCQDKIEIMENMVVDLPVQAEEIISDKFEIVDNEFNAFKDEISERIDSEITTVTESIQQNNDLITANQNAISTNASEIADNKEYIYSVKSNLDTTNQKLANAENVLQTKLDKLAVKNAYDNGQDKTYSSNYINTNFGKKIHKSQKQFTYVGTTSMQIVHQITAPANGYIMIYFGTWYGNMLPSQIGIGVHPRPIVASSTSLGIEAAPMGVTYFGNVTANQQISFYVQCSRIYDGNNTGYIKYILVED